MFFVGQLLAGAIAALALVVPTTQCDRRQLGREFKDAAIPGIELLPGLVSGMSREDVKRVLPSFKDGRAQVELLPGRFYRAELFFGKLETEWLSGLEIEGSWHNDPKEALTKLLGEPVDVTNLIMGWSVHRDSSTREQLGAIHRLKWCDHGRVLLLYTDSDDFKLNITTEARRKLPHKRH